MTLTEIQELRDWSARKMEYTEPFDRGNVLLCKDKTDTWIQWTPDNPSTGQIWILVERMMEQRIDGSNGFNFNLNWQTHKGTPIATAQFHCIASNLEYGQGADNNPCLAILKAARATED